MKSKCFNYAIAWKSPPPPTVIRTWNNITPFEKKLARINHVNICYSTSIQFLNHIGHRICYSGNYIAPIFFSHPLRAYIPTFIPLFAKIATETISQRCIQSHWLLCSLVNEIKETLSHWHDAFFNEFIWFSCDMATLKIYVLHAERPINVNILSHSSFFFAMNELRVEQRKSNEFRYILLFGFGLDMVYMSPWRS